MLSRDRKDQNRGQGHNAPRQGAGSRRDDPKSIRFPQQNPPPLYRPQGRQGGGNAKPRRTPSKGVPPLDAFDRVQRMPPPNLGATAGQGGLPQEKELRKKQWGHGENQRQAPPGKQAAKAERRKPKRTRTPAQRRRMRRIAAVLVVVALIAAGVFFSMEVFFKIERFTISGETRYSEGEVISAFGHELEESMLAFNAGAEQERMQQILPYLDKVTIQRKLPGTIVFHLTEAVPTYFVEIDNLTRYVVLGADMKVLEIREEKPADITMISGLGEPEAVPGQRLKVEDEALAASVQDLVARLQQAGYEEVNWIDLSDPAGIFVRWKDRFTVVLGSKSNLEAKLEFAKLVLTDTAQSGIGENDKGTLDVSGYPATPEARFQPE